MVWTALSSRTFPYITGPSNVSHQLRISLRHYCSLKIYRSPDKNEHEICAWLLSNSVPLPLFKIQSLKHTFDGSLGKSAQFNLILSINHHNFKDNRIVSWHAFSLRRTDSSDLVLCDPFNTYPAEFIFFHSRCALISYLQHTNNFFSHRNYISCYSI